MTVTKTWGVLFSVVLAVSAGGSLASVTAENARHEISGADLRIFEAALEGMAANGYALHAPLEGYRLGLVETDEIYVVHFSDPNRPMDVMGSSPNMQEFEVQLRKDDLTFIRWIGVR